MSEVAQMPVPKYSISVVLPEQAASFWAEVSGYLTKAIDRSRNRWTLEHLLAKICLGKHLLWVAYNAEDQIHGVMTTQVITYPNNRMLAVQFLAGENFKDWGSDMLNKIRSYAKETNCDGIEVTARAGFWPFLKGEGFDRSYIVFEQILEDT